MVGPNILFSLANGNKNSPKKISPAFVCHTFLGDIPYHPAPQEDILVENR